MESTFVYPHELDQVSIVRYPSKDVINAWLLCVLNAEHCNLLIPHILYPNRKDSRYSEKDAAVVVRQMLKVAAECHLHGLVHRDMKPEVYSKSARWNWSVKIKRSYEVMHYFVLPELPLQVIKGGFTP